MAQASKRLPANVAGDFFVDSSCIDCGTCRWMAPAVFDHGQEHSKVYRQPEGEADVLAALRAVVACPAASIGTVEHHDVASVAASFPVPIAANVYHCGYHHRSSYGATSYLIVRPQGNVLIDSPRFAGPLVERLEALGGVAMMFLTHRDDVAEHERFAERFGCTRVLHADDVTTATQKVEQQPQGVEVHALADDLLMIPVPGHTRGSACLLYDGTFLFTGDHLAWNVARDQLCAFRGACWYDWPSQVESMRRLAEFDFEHVLPGHGAPCHFDVPTMRDKMRACVEWMASR
ncbi:MAG: MBL fold metallo-hydrolase [Myxococcota bacterium]